MTEEKKTNTTPPIQAKNTAETNGWKEVGTMTLSLSSGEVKSSPSTKSTVTLTAESKDKRG